MVPLPRVICTSFLYYCLLSITHISASEEAKPLNLAIVYEQNEGLFPISYSDNRRDVNLIVSSTIANLFASKKTPILLPGSRALNFGWHFFKQTESASTAFRDDCDDISREESKSKLVDLCKNAFEYKKGAELAIFSTPKPFSKGGAGVAELDTTWALLQDFRYFDEICGKKCRPAGLDLLCLESFDVDKYLRKFCTINSSEWFIYVVKETPQHFVLFIPRDYAAGYGVDLEDSSNLKRLGFDPATVEKIEAKFLVERTVAYEFDDKKIASSITRVFYNPSSKEDSSYNKLTAPKWNIFLMGHGLPTETNETALITMLKSSPKTPATTTSEIAGMPAYEFLKLMTFWTTIPTNIIAYQTCFGGGLNAQAIQQLYRLAAPIAQFDREHYVHFPVILSIASGERSTVGSPTADYSKFFNTVTAAFTAEKTQAEMRSILKEATLAISSDEPVILFPQQVVLPPHTIKAGSTIDESSKPSREQVEKARKTILQKKFVDKIHYFSHLTEPAYVLSKKGDTLTLSGTQAKSKNITISDSEIVFTPNTPDEPIKIALETDTITKSLVFTAGKPTFNIRPEISSVRFKEIRVPKELLDSFFLRLFADHGRPLRVFIDSCTGLGGRQVGTDSGEQTLYRVKLFRLPPQLAPFLGNLTFGFSKEDDKRRIYFLLQEDGLTCITSFPTDEEFKLKVELAHAFFDGNIAAIVNLLAKHTSLFLVADQLTKVAIGALGLAQGEMTKAIEGLTEAQKNTALENAIYAPSKVFANALLTYGAKISSNVPSAHLKNLFVELEGPVLVKAFENLTEKQKNGLRVALPALKEKLNKLESSL
jgi:hypothetical protein